MNFIVPPKNQGQIVEVSYAFGHDGNGYKRVYNRADRSETLYACDLADCGCKSECDCFDPANTAPKGFTWVAIEALPE